MKRNMIFGHFQRGVALFTLICLLCAACGEDNRATAMQLMRTEGAVSISDGEGETLTPVSDMRLYSGYGLATGRKSYAWINLDSVKLTKMDAFSGIEIRKDGNDLEIFVSEGKVYFNVTEPLTDEESLNIRTTTMAVGIRGTCGWVEVEDDRHMKTYLLEGTVECSVTDPETGRSEQVRISGGEVAEVSTDEEGELTVTTDDFSEENVLPFVMEEVRGDKELQDRIFEDSGLDLSSGGSGPENSADQALRELTGAAASASEDSFRDRIKESGEASAFSQGSGYGGLSRISEEESVKSMLNGAGEELPGYLRVLADAFLAGTDSGTDDPADYMQIRMAKGINCYKPNIYLYGDAGSRLELSFGAPMLLTKTLPEYRDAWDVEIAGDGTLTVNGEQGYPFLFYESETLPGIWQRQEGFLVQAEGRAERFEEILDAYGFNDRETADFIEFWDEMLNGDKDYVMYPQTTEAVDGAMPITLSGAVPENYFRIWFCFKETEPGEISVISEPVIQPASHEGNALVEWGGMILP